MCGRLVRDLKNKLWGEALERWKEELGRFERVLQQKRQDSNKIYSLHEPHVQYIAKGKQHKPYEFGSKASFIIGKHSGIVLGALNIEVNDYDGHTLDEALDQFDALNGYRPEKGIVDLGYRGRKKVGTTQIQTPTPPANATATQRYRLRQSMRRRVAIEATISHLKRDHRLHRNFYKAVAGDHYNVLLAAAAANFARWMRKAAGFCQQILEAMQALWRWITTPRIDYNTSIKFLNHPVPVLAEKCGVFKG